MNLKQKISEIANHYDIADLYVFGSRAKEIAARIEEETIPHTLNSSDADFGVFPTQLESWSPDKRVKLSMELEDLLQVERIDLVLLPEADPYLVLDIIRGELLYTKDPDQQARYELYVIRRADDLLPFKKERHRMILEEGAR
jgi:predicted nucleotidyltransferase